MRSIENIIAPNRYGMLPMDDATRIKVLLAEYETLRSEIISRMNSRFNIIGYIGAIMAFFVVQINNIDWTQFYWPEEILHVRAKIGLPTLLLLGGLTLLFLIWVIFGSLVKKLSRRISQLEFKINAIANENLLTWETEQTKTNPLHRYNP
jgi:hypothetical protein